MKFERSGRKLKVGDRYPGGQLKRAEVPVIERRDNGEPYRRLEKRSVAENAGTSSVYVITAGENGAVKIGVSAEPAKRANSIQAAQDREVRVRWAVQLSAEDAWKLERLVHRHLRKINAPWLRGEWYTMAPDQAVGIIRKQIELAGFASKPDPQFGFTFP